MRLSRHHHGERHRCRGASAPSRPALASWHCCGCGGSTEHIQPAPRSRRRASRSCVATASESSRGVPQAESLTPGAGAALAAQAGTAEARLPPPAAYPVLLAMVFKLAEAESVAREPAAAHPEASAPFGLLERFIAAKPEVLSVSFLTWLATQEADAPPGPLKQRLAQLCERLVIAREVQEQERFEQLHRDVVSVLAAGEGGDDQQARAADPALITFGARSDAREQAMLGGGGGAAAEEQQPALPAGAPRTQEEGRSLQAPQPGGGRASLATPQELQDPRRYALRLSEAVTGRPVATSGYGEVYDALLAVAPPAAMSPEGLALAHQQAGELAQDLANRRRRSVASILGRVQVTPEQAAQLMAGSAAARILDLLLALPDAQERVALLPDCFTPPAPGEAGASAGAGGGAPADAAAEETEELWCTPAQLLSELDARLKQLSAPAAGGAASPPSGGAPRALPAVEGQLVGEELKLALVELRTHVQASLMERLS